MRGEDLPLTQRMWTWGGYRISQVMGRIYLTLRGRGEPPLHPLTRKNDGHLFGQILKKPKTCKYHSTLHRGGVWNSKTQARKNSLAYAMSSSLFRRDFPKKGTVVHDV